MNFKCKIEYWFTKSKHKIGIYSIFKTFYLDNETLNMEANKVKFDWYHSSAVSQVIFPVEIDLHVFLEKC